MSSTTTDYTRRQVTGRGIPVPGNDIDTDRIIPARFLKEVTFESMGEHAPQALMRWGIRAIVGGSYGEIFFGNCVMLGIPCMVVSQDDLEWLQKAIARNPHETVTVHVEKQEVRFGDRVIEAAMPDGPRNQLVGGTWDSTAVLLEAGGAIEATAKKLPYVTGF